MRLVYILRGKSVIQFICMIAIAVTTVFHVDASLGSTRLDGTVSIAANQDDDPGNPGKVVVDLCNFCSWTAAYTDFLTPSSVEAGHRSVPVGRTRSLIPYQLPATAPPPKS